ncbi:uncharacterized protein [Nothobranchius furzeri]|uniref:uncharacterized protein isoform X2 n=1 Tax=Nothobranchius furzeri TaxID=105023 RepID=UPI0039049B77
MWETLFPLPARGEYRRFFSPLPPYPKALCPVCARPFLHFFWKLEIIKNGPGQLVSQHIDKIFSTMRTGEGAPGCPSGTEPAGYIMDSWKQWNLICLSQLSVEDSEDVWIFVVLVSRFLLFGLSGYLAYWKINELSRNIGSIPELRDGLHGSVNAQTHIIVEMSRKLGTLAEIQALAQKVDSIKERVDGSARIDWDRLITPLLVLEGLKTNRTLRQRGNYLCLAPKQFLSESGALEFVRLKCKLPPQKKFIMLPSLW